MRRGGACTEGRDVRRDGQEAGDKQATGRGGAVTVARWKAEGANWLYSI
jgi:hypothetical protein